MKIKQKYWLYRVLPLVIVTITALLFSFSLFQTDLHQVAENTEETEKPIQPEVYGDPWNPVLVTFEVTVPNWTPNEDRIFLVVDGYMPELEYGLSRGIPMKEKEPNVWTVIFKAPEDYNIRYKYNRNNFGYAADEEFFPDSPDTWREVFVHDEPLLIQDKVEKWRWLSEKLPQVNLSTFRPDSLPHRDEPFIIGVFLIDYFDPTFREFFPSTLDRIKEGGFEYIGVAMSASTFVSSNPLVFSDEYYEAGLEDLELIVTEARKRGLKIVLSGGIETAVTGPVTFEDIEAEFRKPQSDEWYLQLVEKWEESMVRLARVAEEYNIEILTPSDQWFVWGDKTEEQKRMLNPLINKAYEEIRKVYSGKISSDIYVLDEAFDYYKQLDWIGDKWWWGLSDKKETTLEEMKLEAERIIDTIYAPAYNKYNKPIFLQQVGYASYDGAAGAVQISTEDPAVAEWYPYNDEYPLDFQEQADAYEAVFQAIYDDPRFVGAFSFGYAYLDLQEKAAGIRGKPAEDVWIKWNNIFKELQS